MLGAAHCCVGFYPNLLFFSRFFSRFFFILCLLKATDVMGRRGMLLLLFPSGEELPVLLLLLVCRFECGFLESFLRHRPAHCVLRCVRSSRAVFRCGQNLLADRCFLLVLRGAGQRSRCSWTVPVAFAALYVLCGLPTLKTPFPEKKSLYRGCFYALVPRYSQFFGHS